MRLPRHGTVSVAAEGTRGIASRVGKDYGKATLLLPNGRAVVVTLDTNGYWTVLEGTAGMASVREGRELAHGRIVHA